MCEKKWEWEYEFSDSKGRTIKLAYDGSNAMYAYHGHQQVGHFEWDIKAGEVALLTLILLDRAAGNEKYTRCGIGTKIVEQIPEMTGVPVAVCRDIGTTRGDGGHPTGMAMSFYKSLVTKKLAHWYGESSQYEQYDDDDGCV